MHARAVWILALCVAGCEGGGDAGAGGGAGGPAADATVGDASPATCVPEDDAGCFVATIGDETGEFHGQLQSFIDAVKGRDRKLGDLQVRWPYTTTPATFTCGEHTIFVYQNYRDAGGGYWYRRLPRVGGECRIELLEVRPNWRGTFEGAFDDGTPFTGSFDVPIPAALTPEGRLAVTADGARAEADMLEVARRDDRLVVVGTFLDDRAPMYELGVGVPLRGVGTWRCADAPDVGLGANGGTEAWGADRETPGSDCVVEVTAFGDVVEGTFRGTLAPVVEATAPIVLVDGEFSFPRP